MGTLTAFTSDELNELRKSPQTFEPRLAFFQPPLIWEGTLNGEHARGARTLSVITTNGVISNILEDTVLIINSGNNEEHYRIKSTTSNTITIQENAHRWSTSDTLKAILYFEPMPVFHRIITDYVSATQYEDFDVSYTDQNLNFDPVVNMGPAAIVVEKDDSPASLFLDTEDSFVYGATISGYEWGVSTGTYDPSDVVSFSDGDNHASTATINFDDTGNFYIWCEITADNGKSYKGYRPVMVVDDDSDNVIKRFEFDLSGSRESGYWSSSITIFEDCPITRLQRNIPLVIYGHHVRGFDGVENDVGWYYKDFAHQKYVGWTLEETITDEYQVKGLPVSFSTVGLGGIMEQLKNYPMWLQYNNSPTDWTQLRTMSVDRAAWFFLRRRSNLLRLTDWHPTGNTLRLQYSEIPDGTMFSGLRNFYSGTIFGELCSDRMSTLWAEIDAQMLSDSDRTSAVPIMFELEPTDHFNEITLPTTRDMPELAWISIDGLYYKNGVNVPMISYAPGYVVNNRGGAVEEISGLVTPELQEDLNDLAGRLFTSRNNPRKEISIELNGDWELDIAPQSCIQYSMSTGTFREETISNDLLLLREIRDVYNPSNLFLHNGIITESVIRDADAVVHDSITRSMGGVEGLFPPVTEGVDPDDYTDWGDYYDWTDTEIPPAAESQFLPVPDIDESPIMYAWNAQRIAYSESITTSPIWNNVYDFSTLGTGDIEACEMDSWNPIENAYVTTVDSSHNLYIYHITGMPYSPSVELIYTFLHTASTFNFHCAPYIISPINFDDTVFVTYADGRGAISNRWINRFIKKYGTGSPEYDEVSNIQIGANNLAAMRTSVSGVGHYQTDDLTMIYTPGYQYSNYLYKSMDRGESWTQVWDSGDATTEGAIRAIMFPYGENTDMGRFYLTTGQKVYRFDYDTPTDITPAITGIKFPRSSLSDKDMYHLSVSTNYKTTVRTLALDGLGCRLLQSFDSGATWSNINLRTLLSLGASEFYRSLDAWPFNETRLIIASSDRIPYTSPDSGETWNSLAGDWTTKFPGEDYPSRVFPIWFKNP